MNIFVAIGIIYDLSQHWQDVASLQTFSFHYSTNKLLEEHFSIYTRDEKYLDIKDENK